jgi:SAM-dependent methyltransferase
VTDQRYNRGELEKEFGNLRETSPLIEQSVDKKSIITIAGHKAAFWLNLRSKDTLLDIGTGMGRWAFHFAPCCNNVIGIDISENLLAKARKKALGEGINNVHFVRGSFENFFEEESEIKAEPNKILCVYAFHHLTDSMKAEFLKDIARRWKHPLTLVIADLMWFTDPKTLRDQWDDVFYDEGDTDFPPDAFWLKEVGRSHFDTAFLVKIHPLVGILVAETR